MCAYHGGNLYREANVLTGSAVENLKDMPGNPFFVMHNAYLSTRMNIFNSHGTECDDAWVDIRVFDKTGNLVYAKEKSIYAERNKCVTLEVKEYLPENCREFIGHIALNYNRDKTRNVTVNQQCLVEYYTSNSISRVMLWSDMWNSDQRQARTINYKSYQRAWIAPDIKTYFAVVNNSIHLDYRLSADYVVRVIGDDGKERIFNRCVGPQATDYFKLEDLDPEITSFYQEQDVVFVLIESQRDLANIQLTFRESHGICAAEHNMAWRTIQDGVVYNCTGA